VLQLGYSFFDVPLGGCIAEDLHRTDNGAFPVPHRQNPNTDRNPVPLLMVEIELRLHRLPATHDVAHGTGAVAQGLAALVHVSHKVVEAAFPDGLTGGVSTQPLRSFVPVGNLALLVHEVDPVVHVVEELLVERRRKTNSPEGFARLLRSHSIQPPGGLHAHGNDDMPGHDFVGADPAHLNGLVGLQQARQGQAAAVPAHRGRPGSVGKALPREIDPCDLYRKGDRYPVASAAGRLGW